MSESTRQLAAIMFTDIVGYTALMGEDEEKAYALLKKNRQVQKPLIEKHDGKWLKEIGDGVLASFQTVTDAAYCAIEIQLACKEELDLKLRIGIHLGEVIVEDGDVFGDGVNIASRLEPLAPVGGIYISESVYRNIENKKGLKAEFIREENLKNVKHPVRIYEVKVELTGDMVQSKIPKSHTQNEHGKSISMRTMAISALAVIILFLIAYFLYFKPETEAVSSPGLMPGQKNLSIAVLPFKNWSGDPANEPFCDGMTDAVIIRLTKLEGISKVISMTSVMRYKQTEKSMPEIAEELDVTHILAASFQKAGNLVKVTLKLIDGPSDNHYWSNEYTGNWDIGIFQMQAEVAENVAENMGAQISDKEIESIRKRPTNNEKAYNFYIQAEFQRNKANKQASENAIQLYERAIELDPDFAIAYIGLGTIWSQGGLFAGIYKERNAWKNAKKLFQKAMDIDSTIKINYEMYTGYFYYDWNFGIVEEYYQSILNPLTSEIKSETFISDHNVFIFTDYPLKTGRYNEALSHINNLIQADPSYGLYYTFKARVLMFLGRNEDAIDLLENAGPLYNDRSDFLKETTKSYYYLGEYQKFRSHLNRMVASFPDENPPLVVWFNIIQSQLEGKDNEVNIYLDQLDKKYEDGSSGSPAWFIALYYCHIGNYENAFEWLQKSYEQHEVEMTWLREEPLLIPVREDPRYKELYRKIGFPG